MCIYYIYVSYDCNNRQQNDEVVGKRLLLSLNKKKMPQNGLAGEAQALGESGGQTVVVGVKLDSPSRELLTWALVKVAQPGDLVVALHVLGHDGNGKKT